MSPFSSGILYRGYAANRHLSDFLAATLCRTYMVCDGFTLDVHYCSPNREVICLVKHIELRFFDVTQMMYFIAAEATGR